VRYIYLYRFRGNEATFQVEADSIDEADKRVDAMKSAQFEGTVAYEVPIDDDEMRRISRRLN
jgi:hypothetical protein